MPDRPSSPRIAPLPETEWDERTRELLGRAGVPNGETTNIFTTLVRHPRLFRHWLPFGGALLTGSLPARDREIVILRTAWLCRSVYEWGQHVRLARTAGLTAAEIAQIAVGPTGSGWSTLEVALLRATEELHDDNCVGDATWHVLAEHYDDQQLVEVVMLVGQYHMVAGALNSFGVQPEPGVPGFPE
ncbi:MAG: carboxymuconolactone decarboxylase family protein [Acidimicrobiia bacterium]